MNLYRTILPTPLGEMLALSSDAGLCALEFTTVQGRARGQERLTRLDARLRRWFPPHEMVDRETPVIAQARRWLDDYFSGDAADISQLAPDSLQVDFGVPGEVSLCVRIWARVDGEELKGRVLYRSPQDIRRIAGPARPLNREQRLVWADRPGVRDLGVTGAGWRP